jgi:photosystem II stability/assembly factor-like uncharacterized protein
MNHKWQFISQVAEGGTILGLHNDSKGRLWAVTSAGLFRKEDQAWLPIQGNLPFLRVAAFKPIRKLHFAGGVAGGIAYSLDGSNTWHEAWVNQVQSPVACFAVSPNYSKDHVLLAGTLGEGILRTTDGGRHWQLENFGLQGFNIFALAAVAVEQTFRELRYVRDYVYAGTDDGVYVSPNGGRAWKPASKETSGQVILSVTISPDFQEDRTLFVGSEMGDLFRSQNGGENWERLDLGKMSPGAINCMVCLADGTLLLGTSDAGILGSVDRGESWEQHLKGVPPVLALEEINGMVLTGLYRDGLMKSNDLGRSWNPEKGFAAHRFAWLEAPPSNQLLAASPDEGIWTSIDQGEHWSRLSTWDEGRALLGFTAEKESLLAAAPDGIWYSADSGKKWILVFDAARLLPSMGMLSGLYHFAWCGDTIWCGGESGLILQSEDRGLSWQRIDTPFHGIPIIMLKAPTNWKDTVLVAGLKKEEFGEIQVWRLDSKQAWKKWHQEKTPWFTLHMAFWGAEWQRSIFGLGTRIYEERVEENLTLSLNLDHDPVTALAAFGDGVHVAASSFDTVFYRAGVGVWQPYQHDLQGEMVVGLQFSPQFESDRTLFVLTNSGKFWKAQIGN